MDALGDKTIIKAALNVYAASLRGIEKPSEIQEGTLKRVEELRTKGVKANSFVITIVLDV